MPMRQINDVIHQQPILTTAEALSVRDACCQMAARRVGSIMIVDAQGLLTGIFTERDALNRVLAAGLDPDKTPLDAVMTHAPVTITADHPLGHALHLMEEGGFRHVPVVDQGRPIGMISARDALGCELLAFEAELEQREMITELL